MKKISTKYYWVYILLCENNSYYTGYTNNLEKRYTKHINNTASCKYTRSFKPITILQCWYVLESKTLAMQLERHIKRLPKFKKVKLIALPNTLSEDPRVKPIKKQELKKMLSLWNLEN